MNPSIEVILPGDGPEVYLERLAPLFFIVGGADDSYLAKITNVDEMRSVDPIPTKPYVIYGARGTIGYVRTFPLNDLLNKKWPILYDITNPESKGCRAPDVMETVWIVRALKRMGSGLSEILYRRMLEGLYKIRLKIELNREKIAELYRSLSDEQKHLPMFRMVEDVPVRLKIELGPALQQLALSGCSDLDWEILQATFYLLSLPKPEAEPNVSLP